MSLTSLITDIQDVYGFFGPELTNHRIGCYLCSLCIAHKTPGPDLQSIKLIHSLKTTLYIRMFKIRFDIVSSKGNRTLNKITY